MDESVSSSRTRLVLRSITVRLDSVFQAVSLETFRSLQDKLCLLDVAVSAHDGNIITAVTYP